MKNENQLKEMFTKLYDGSWYTIIGVDGVDEFKKNYKSALLKLNIGEIKEFVSFTGKEMNHYYGLKGNVKYKDDLVFLAFPLDGLEICNLAMFKIMNHDRWFDDIVDNNEYHMNQESLN